MINWDDFVGLVKGEILKDGPLVRYIWDIKMEYDYCDLKLIISFNGKNTITLKLVDNLLSLLLDDDHIWGDDIKELKINKKEWKIKDVFENDKVKDIFEEKNLIEIEYSKKQCLDYEVNCIIYPIWKNKDEDYAYLLELEKW